MKKLQILSILLILGLLSLINCSKERELTVGNDQHAVSIEFQTKVTQDILQFLDKVEVYKSNPNLKNDESMDVDSALWYLESCFNYSYGFPNEFYKTYQVDTIYLTLELTGNRRVSMNALIAKYEQMIEEVRSVYHGSAFEQKGLALINLQEASGTAENIHFAVNVVTGEKTDDIPPQPVLEGPFGDEDYWWYGEMEGRCEEFLMDSDAAQQLMMAMNASLPDPTGNFYVINPVFKDRKGGDPNVRRPNDPLDNSFDYYLFCASEEVGPVNLCLERNTMNTYFNFLRYLGHQKIKEDEGLESVYSLICITKMLGLSDWNLLRETTNYYHECSFQYGIKIHYLNGDAAVEL